MYNLIMSSFPGFWDQSPQTFSVDRIFEHTKKFLVDKFQSLEGPALKEILDFPTLFAYEQVNDEDACIGRVIELRKRGKEVRIAFELDEALPRISASTLKQLEWELEIGEWEFNRTHWAIKDVDLLFELSKAGIISATQYKDSALRLEVAPQSMRGYTVSPSIFRVPDSNIEADLVSVMRPFDVRFDRVQATLKAACDNLELRCLDVNDIWNESEIIQDVFSLIYRSKAVICDFSDRNANVFYEAGIAHTLGRTVIPIVQNFEHIPFDLRQHRYISYLSNDEGLEKLGSDVSKRLRSVFDRS